MMNFITHSLCEMLLRRPNRGGWQKWNTYRRGKKSMQDLGWKTWGKEITWETYM
jgi:hypothetical protein